MRKALKIGEKEFKFKKDALAYYRTILNKYDFGQILNDSDFDDLIDLIEYDDLNSSYEFEVADAVGAEDDSAMIAEELTIEDIRVSKVQFDTKCFEVLYSDKTSQYISYLMMISNKKYTPERLFFVACRNAVHGNIRSVKQDYFDKNSVKGTVKCQETGILSKWTELVIDHRQPNTFAVIVDRFVEVNRFTFDSIGYVSNDQNHIVFEDEAMSDSFRIYHKEKANLRIVRTECNSSRIGMARLGRTSKDLAIN